MTEITSKVGSPPACEGSSFELIEISEATLNGSTESDSTAKNGLQLDDMCSEFERVDIDEATETPTTTGDGTPSRLLETALQRMAASHTDHDDTKQHITAPPPQQQLEPCPAPLLATDDEKKGDGDGTKTPVNVEDESPQKPDMVQSDAETQTSVPDADHVKNSTKAPVSAEEPMSQQPDMIQSDAETQTNVSDADVNKMIVADRSIDVPPPSRVVDTKVEPIQKAAGDQNMSTDGDVTKAIAANMVELDVAVKVSKSRMIIAKLCELSGDLEPPLDCKDSPAHRILTRFADGKGGSGDRVTLSDEERGRLAKELRWFAESFDALADVVTLPEISPQSIHRIMLKLFPKRPNQPPQQLQSGEEEGEKIKKLQSGQQPQMEKDNEEVEKLREEFDPLSLGSASSASSSLPSVAPPEPSREALMCPLCGLMFATDATTLFKEAHVAQCCEKGFGGMKEGEQHEQQPSSSSGGSGSGLVESVIGPLWNWMEAGIYDGKKVMKKRSPKRVMDDDLPTIEFGEAKKAPKMNDGRDREVLQPTKAAPPVDTVPQPTPAFDERYTCPLCGAKHISLKEVERHVDVCLANNDEKAPGFRQKPAPKPSAPLKEEEEQGGIGSSGYPSLPSIAVPVGRPRHQAAPVLPPRRRVVHPSPSHIPPPPFPPSYPPVAPPRMAEDLELLQAMREGDGGSCIECPFCFKRFDTDVEPRSVEFHVAVCENSTRTERRYLAE